MGLLKGGRRIVLFSNGLALIRGDHLEVCLWEEIASIRFARTSNDLPIIPLVSTVHCHDGRRLKVYQKIFTDHPGLFAPQAA
jgi:hypothetical protein